MIPNELDDWTYELIENLVESGVFESDRFDFKVGLPDRNDPRGKDRLEKSVCAFANTEGGFLIFGVKDDRSLSCNDKIIGINPADDFPRKFGDKINNVNPHVYYDFKNPAIEIPHTGNYVHVFKINQSPERPHMTSKNMFYFRTNKGNEPMNYQQIKNSFLSEEQRRQKLRLLFIELLSNKEQSTFMIISEDKITDDYTLIEFDSTILQALLVDIYPIIIREEELIKLLFRIRETIKIINNKNRIFYNAVSLPSMNQKKIIKVHNEFVNLHVRRIIPWLDRALEILQDKYGLNNPFE